MDIWNERSSSGKITK